MWLGTLHCLINFTNCTIMNFSTYIFHFITTKTINSVLKCYDYMPSMDPKVVNVG